VKVEVSVNVSRQRAFDLFTTEIDLWWRRSVRFRNFTDDRAFICIERKVEGRVFESCSDGSVERVFEIGRVTRWQPHSDFAFTWRNANFAEGEITHVEIEFSGDGDTTLVTVVHSGWAALRPDHPARHGAPIRAFQSSMGRWWGDQLSAYRRVTQE
jgi:Activator of Hsp90 ATPase homolog 1-like protein